MKAEPAGKSVNWLALSGMLCALAVVLCWHQWRRLNSAEQTLNVAAVGLETMRANAIAIDRLRSEPRRATERQLPHDQLVALIERAMKQAALPPTSLSSVWPDPPRRIPDQDYLELNTRLQFDRVQLEEFIPFVYSLGKLDTSLRASSLRLLAGQNDRAHWDAELMISYLIYSPRNS